MERPATGAQQARDTRPASATAIPVALVALAVLDLATAFVHGRGPQLDGEPARRMAYAALALGGSIELTAAALIAMRRVLGRLLYVGIMPLRIAASAVAAWAMQAAAPAANALPGAAGGLIVDVVIFIVVAFLLFRPRLSAWLADAPPGPGPPDGGPPSATPQSHLRIGAFVCLLLFLVFVLDAPIAVLYVGAVTVALMIAVHAYSKRS